MSCCCCKDNKNKYSIEVRVVVLLGAPGSGKGTVAQYLLDNYNVLHFSTGNLLRNEVKEDTEIGREVSSIMGSGGLVSDDIVNRVVESNLMKALATDSVILLDGYPRTLAQAKYLDRMCEGNLEQLVRVIELKVDRELAIARVSRRRICSECGATFGPLDDAKCSRCGGALVKRADDEEVVVRRRMLEYDAVTRPVSGHYECRLYDISGEAPPEKVVREVDEAFRDFFIKKRR